MIKQASSLVRLVEQMEVLNTQEEAHMDDLEGIKICQKANHEGSKLQLQRSPRLPWGAWLFEQAALSYQLSASMKRKIHQLSAILLTYCCYAAYHMNRKSISVVKSTLHPDCNSSGLCANPSNSCAGWEPFDDPSNGRTLLGTLDYAWLFSYAVAMFFSGQLADRSNLRYFLTLGMLGSAVSAMLLGLTYFLNIHKLFYFILVQILGGTFQASGFPAIITVMSNWFGKGKRGLIMGVWYTHNQTGSILGTIIPAIFAHHHWGWSFMVPAAVMIVITIIIFLFLVTDPCLVGLPPPKHHLDDDKVTKTNSNQADTSTESDTTAANANAIATMTDDSNQEAISLWKAMLIPGVLEFSLAHFFAKMVSYSFLLWLPFYLKNTEIGEQCLDTFQSGLLAATFDVGGIIGSIGAGFLSDLLDARAVAVILLLYLSIPMIFFLRNFGDYNLPLAIFLVFITGVTVVGPHSVITSAVSADLGTHKSLKGNRKAKSTITGIINGIGSIGAAFGPLITGALSSHEGWDAVFYLFMALYFASGLLLTRLVIGEVKRWRIFQKLRRKATGKRVLLVSESELVSEQESEFI